MSEMPSAVHHVNRIAACGDPTQRPCQSVKRGYVSEIVSIHDVAEAAGYLQTSRLQGNQTS
jgi:hypothetical protein